MNTTRNFATKDHLIRALRAGEVILVDTQGQLVSDGDILTIQGPHGAKEWLAEVEVKNCDNGCMITRLIS